MTFLYSSPIFDSDKRKAKAKGIKVTAIKSEPQTFNAKGKAKSTTFPKALNEGVSIVIDVSVVLGSRSILIADGDAV